MEGQTIWWKSKAMWGALITMGLSLFSLLHQPINLDQASIDLLSGQIVNFIVQVGSLITLVSGFMSWWGRLTATKEMSKNVIMPPKQTLGSSKKSSN